MNDEDNERKAVKASIVRKIFCSEPTNPFRWLEDIAYELNLIRKNLDEFVRIWKNDLDRVEKKLEELEHGGGTE